MGTLARGIAHDFNNILGTILGYNEMAIEESVETDRVQKYLSRMKQASLRARDLVNQILTFSRDFAPEPKPMKVQKVIQDSLTLFYPNLTKNVKVKTDIAKSLPALFADPMQIQQVILNLLTNANQAMEDTGGLITISVNKISADETLTELLPEPVREEYIRISVGDNGPGMDAAIQMKIFEPFFTTKPVGIGTGLGLSVVHGIINNHQGAITLDSEPEKGSTFNVYLPV